MNGSCVKSVSKDAVIVFVVPSLKCDYIGVDQLAACIEERANIKMHAISLTQKQKARSFIRKYSHCIFAFSTFTPYAEKAKRFAVELKRVDANVVTIFGGVYASFCPEVIESVGVDAVCIGEGEESIPDFVCSWIDNKHKIPINISGFWIKDKEGRVIRNATRAINRDLDTLPLPKRDLFLNAAFVRNGFRRFMFARGCPMKCSYCSVAKYPSWYGAASKDFCRVKSPSAAVEEIVATLKKYGGDIVAIVDPIFGVSIDWLRDFCRLYKEKVNKPFYCNTEVNFVSEEYASLLSEAGCYYVFIGFETANDRVRNEVLNKHFKTEEFLLAVADLQKRGIRISVYNMIGIPDGTIEDDLETLRLNQQINADFSQSKVFSLYPGIELYKRLHRQGAKKDVISNVYWSAVRENDDPEMLKRLLRLQCLFSLFVYWKVPVGLTRILIKVPLHPVYRVLAFLLNKYHYGKLRYKKNDVCAG